MFRNWSLNRMLILVVTLGFLGLCADSILEHRDTLDDRWTAYIPIVFSAIGFLFGVRVTFAWKAMCIRVMHYFLMASIAVAALGFYFHIEDEEDDEDLTAEQREHEKNEKEKPLLAPLAFAGIAAFGLLGTSRRRQAEVSGRG
jgi:hypothetical protein